ncbi:MAG: InlB B-repeat-containing protein [Dehalococcoidia bacterium]|nr:InlB B-repeat-containing protein [Dehalococcoidia bacterium]
MDVSSSNSGTVRIDYSIPSHYPFTSTWTSGITKTLEALPADGYVFDYWTGALTGSENPVKVVMGSDKSIIAHFHRLAGHTLAMQVYGSGTITPDVGNYSCDDGEIVNIVATPDVGWLFGGWDGDGVADPTSADTTVTVNSDRTITAVFYQYQPRYILTMQTTGGGTVTPGTQMYNSGTVVDITAIPMEGWKFDGWSGNVADASLATTTVTISDNTTIVANFSQSRRALFGWPIIGGIIAGGIAVIVLIVLLVRRRLYYY